MLANRESIEREPERQFSCFVVEQRHFEAALAEMTQGRVVTSGCRSTEPNEEDRYV